MYYQSGFQITRVVKTLLIVTVGCYLVELIPVVGSWCIRFGSLHPSSTLGGQVWRLVTYLFLHDSGSPWHILFNMMGLWMFGAQLEEMWGSRRFTIFYFIAGIGSGIFSLLTVFFQNVPIIGASGAILGLLTVYAYYYPHQQILLFFIIPIPVRIAVIVFGVISLFGAWGSSGGIAHLTHLGGIVVALLYLRYYNKVISLIRYLTTLRSQHQTRRTVEKKVAKDRYFESVIDPILKKIHEKGIGSLTREELENLNTYSKRNGKR